MKFPTILITAIAAASIGQSVPIVATAEQAPAKPSKKEMRGTPVGEIHGGPAGSPFRDKAFGRMSKIVVRSGAWVDAVRCEYDDEGAIDKGTNHGGDGGHETVIDLKPGETLVRFSGTLRESGDEVVIGSLSFKTTERTIGPIGEDTTGKKFALDAPKGREICGFQGRSSSTLDAIGMVCRPLR